MPGLCGTTPAIVNTKQATRVGYIALKIQVFKFQIGRTHKLPASGYIDRVVLISFYYNPCCVFAFQVVHQLIACKGASVQKYGIARLNGVCRHGCLDVRVGLSWAEVHLCEASCGVLE